VILLSGSVRDTILDDVCHESVLYWGHLLLLLEESEEGGVGGSEKGGDGE